MLPGSKQTGTYQGRLCALCGLLAAGHGNFSHAIMMVNNRLG